MESNCFRDKAKTKLAEGNCFDNGSGKTSNLFCLEQIFEKSVQHCSQKIFSFVL